MDGDAVLVGLAAHAQRLAQQPDVAAPGHPVAEERGLLDPAGVEVAQVRHRAAPEPHVLDLGGGDLQRLAPGRLERPGLGVEVLPDAGDGQAAEQGDAGEQAVGGPGVRPRGHDPALDLAQGERPGPVLVAELEPVGLGPLHEARDRQHLAVLRPGQEQVFRPRELEPAGERLGRFLAVGQAELHPHDPRQGDVERGLIGPGGDQPERRPGRSLRACRRASPRPSGGPWHRAGGPPAALGSTARLGSVCSVALTVALPFCPSS